MTHEAMPYTTLPGPGSDALTIQGINALAQRYWTSPRGLMSHLTKHGLIPHAEPAPASDAEAPRPVTSVLVFFHALGIGGGERVTCELAKLWQSLGLRVTILTDVSLDESQAHQILPQGIAHRVIPDYNTLDGSTYSLRSSELDRIIDETHADAMVFAHWFAESLPFDLLVCGLRNMKTYIFIQSLFTLFFLDNLPGYLVDMPLCYRLATGVVSLSDTDRFAWSQFNPHSYATHNPMTSTLPSSPAPLAGHTIIWPARLHPDKCPERVIPIMRELLALVPDARLKMVGPVDDAYAADFLQAAREQKVDHAITLCGAQNPDTMDAFYRDADAFLLTSRREGWSLALAEALSHGIPCVIYALPYLTLAKDNPAVIQIEQDDAASAAQALASVLSDKQEARQVGEKGRLFMKEIARYDLAAFWQELFLGEPDNGAADDQMAYGNHCSIVMREALAAHRDYIENRQSTLALICSQKDTHINNLEHIIAELTRQRDGLHDDLEAVRSSLSFRIGRALTAIPRRIKRLLS